MIFLRMTIPSRHGKQSGRRHLPRSAPAKQGAVGLHLPNGTGNGDIVTDSQFVLLVRFGQTWVGIGRMPVAVSLGIRKWAWSLRTLQAVMGVRKGELSTLGGQRSMVDAASP